MKSAAIACTVALLATSVARAADEQSFSQIERGRYLATAGDCTACHTANDGKPFAGGKAIETPFGTLLAANITPDRETGIGAWTEDEFVRALSDGIGKDGEHLYPAMPYPFYAKVWRQDAIAIYAWLRTLPAVHNEVHSNRLPFPFNQRESLVGWDELFFKKGEYQPVAGRSPEWNRGAYLVQGLGHCGACHTPINALGGSESSRALQGNVVQNWFAPNLTGDLRAGLASWSAEDLVSYFKTGRNRITAATGPMAEVIVDSLSHLTDADLKAMAIYLKDQPATGAASPPPVSDQDRMMVAGQALYLDNCAACHKQDGTGIPRLFPTFRDSPSVQSAQPTSLIRVVLEGARSAATDQAPTGLAMPSFGWKLTDPEIAAVVTYIRNNWGNAAVPVAAGDVGDLRQKLSRK